VRGLGPGQFGETLLQPGAQLLPEPGLVRRIREIHPPPPPGADTNYTIGKTKSSVAARRPRPVTRHRSGRWTRRPSRGAPGKVSTLCWSTRRHGDAPRSSSVTSASSATVSSIVMLLALLLRQPAKRPQFTNYGQAKS